MAETPKAAEAMTLLVRKYRQEREKSVEPEGWWSDEKVAAFARTLLEEAAQIAGGMTGPGNTPEQCQGYSDACRDIRKAIRRLAGKE